MSLVAAAATGLVLGGASSGFVFNYTASEYQQKINQLANLLERLQEHLGKMNELKEAIPSFWDDEHSAKVYTELTDTIRQTETEMETTRSYMATLQTVVDELSRSKTLMSDTIEKLHAALGAGKTV